MLEHPYHLAQRAMADLKSSVRYLIEAGPQEGLKNVELGRALGIYTGHVGHEGHISRTILALLEGEGVVEQDKKTKRWRLRSHSEQ